MLRIIILMFCLPTYVLSQTFEPSTLSFNWHTHVGPFHDSTHQQTRPVLGWQWSSSDTSFDRYMNANTTHAGADLRQSVNIPTYLSSKFCDDSVKWVLEPQELNIIKSCVRFDGEILPNLYSTFTPYKYDSSGAVFGWSTRDAYVVTVDSATTVRPRGFASLLDTGSRLALSNVQPKNALKRLFPNDADSANSLRRMYISVNVMRPNTFSTDTSSDNAILLKMKYWAHATIRNRSNTDDSIIYRDNIYIKFDSMSTH